MASGHWRTGWAALIIASASRAALAVVGCLALWSVLPVTFGWHPTVVMSGSMTPTLVPGDVVVSRPVPAASLKIGQVLLVNDPDHPGRLRLHRLVAFRTDGRLALRGDANAADDSSPVARSAVLGVGALHIPYLGAPAYWLRTHDLAALIALAGALGGVIAGACCYRPAGAVPRPRGRPAPSPRRRRRGARGRAGALVALPLALGAGLGVSVHPAPAAAGAFSKQTANTGDAWTAATYFTCRNADKSASPYLLYPFGESSGTTATDDSGNGHNGTYQGSGTVYGATGPCAADASTAVTLNGTSGYVSTPSTVLAPASSTEEVWFRTTTTHGGDLISLGSAQTGSSLISDRYLFLTDTGRVAFAMKPLLGTVTIKSSTGYADGSWHLADAVLSSTAGMSLYVDGSLVAANANTAGTTVFVTGPYWRIGFDALSGLGTDAPTSNFAAATLADAAIYPTALSAAQIASHYNAR